MSRFVLDRPASAADFPTLRTEIAGVRVAKIAHEFGTPTFVYDAQAIATRVADLQAFDAIRYAQKACSNIGILDLMRREGVLVDAVSAGEIHRALKAGYQPVGVDVHSPRPIVYTADIFDRDALDLVVMHDLHVNCGSPDMIDQLGQVKPGAEITLRINPGFGHGHSQKTNTGGEQSKHGIWHEQLDDCLRRCDHYGIGVIGLHLHIGSGTDLEHLSQVCGALEKLALRVGRSIKTISAGGGLPVPYKPGDTFVDIGVYYKLWDATRKKLEAEFHHPVHLEIEPGRYLVCESGYLVTEIRAVKHMGKNTFYLTDAGFNNLARPILYGSYHPISIVPRHPRPHPEECDVIVGGPLCESGDIFTQTEGGFVCTRRLPLAEVGDWLVLENVGAYGFAMGSNYNSKPYAAEVLVHGQTPYLVRERQSFDDLTRGEVIPKY